MTDDIFVAAGNLHQFQICMNEAQEKWKEEIKLHKVHYVSEAEILRGRPPARVFLYGTYFKRYDWAEIEKEINDGGHRQLLLR